MKGPTTTTATPRYDTLYRNTPSALPGGYRRPPSVQQAIHLESSAEECLQDT